VRGWQDKPTFNDPWRVQLAEKMGELMRDWLVSRDMKAIADFEAELKKAKRKGNAPPTSPPPAWLKLKELERPDDAGNTPLIPRVRPGPKAAYKFLRDDWSSTECVVAGDWMLAVTRALPCFGEDEYGRPCIAPEWQDRVDKICEELERRHPVMLPHRSPPKPWTGWWINYSDRLRAQFRKRQSRRHSREPSL
jgi:hypothetical protein